jgi:hypothetical protein
MYALAAAQTITMSKPAEKLEALEREMNEAGSVACEYT